MRIARSLLEALLTIWLTATLSFFALRLLPGDAISSQLAQGGVSAAEIQRRREMFHLDDPVTEQYARFLLGLARADLGVSITTGLPVTEMISQQITATIALASSALCVAVILGAGLGISAAIDGNPLRLIAARTAIALSISTPVYWIATLAIFFFAARLNWLPGSGSGGFEHLILPASVLGFAASGAIARAVQISVREAATSPFVQTARSKGLSEQAVLYRHVLRVGLIPIAGIIALQAGFLFSGTVITETVFVRPGLGRLLFTAAQFQDYSVVQGIVILSACIYTAFNLAAEMIQPLLDPRAGR